MSLKEADAVTPPHSGYGGEPLVSAPVIVRAWPVERPKLSVIVTPGKIEPGPYPVLAAVQDGAHVPADVLKLICRPVAGPDPDPIMVHCPAVTLLHAGAGVPNGAAQ